MLQKQAYSFLSVAAVVNGCDLIQELLKLEDIQFQRKAKIGVLYAREGQTEEADMLLNGKSNLHFYHGT